MIVMERAGGLIPASTRCAWHWPRPAVVLSRFMMVAAVGGVAASAVEIADLDAAADRRCDVVAGLQFDAPRRSGCGSRDRLPDRRGAGDRHLRCGGARLGRRAGTIRWSLRLFGRCAPQRGACRRGAGRRRRDVRVKRAACRAPWGTRYTVLMARTVRTWDSTFHHCGGALAIAIRLWWPGRRRRRSSVRPPPLPG